MKQKLQIKIHNPNSSKNTADILAKIIGQELASQIILNPTSFAKQTNISALNKNNIW